MNESELRFWSKVDKNVPNPVLNCWNWVGAGRIGGRYGCITLKGKRVLAHRFSYELYFGKIPDGKCVCHRCDNGFCVNPNHLFLGTQKDNMMDCVSKGRIYRFSIRRGENHHNAKLTKEKIIEIRKAYVPGQNKHSDIAKIYGVSTRHICAIINRKWWAHV